MTSTRNNLPRSVHNSPDDQPGIHGRQGRSHPVLTSDASVLLHAGSSAQAVHYINPYGIQMDA